MLASNGYTVIRLNSQQVQVFKAKGKSPDRILYMAVGAKQSASCPCPSYGSCGHQAAALEFTATERKPVAVKSEYQIQMDMLMSPTGC